MDFILGLIAGAVFTYNALFLIRHSSKSRQPVIDEMIGYLDFILLKYWSSDTTRERDDATLKWLESKLKEREKVRESGCETNADAKFLTHLFLELGRESEES